MELQLQNLKPTKSDIKIASDILIHQVDNGEVNAIDVALQLKVIECSLVAAEEMLNEYPAQCPEGSYEMERHLFWQDVKSEIEKI